MTPSPTQSQIQSALRGVLLSILPSGEAAFTATISGTKMTVTNFLQGAISVGDSVLGVGVAPGTEVQSLVAQTPTGGVWTISPSQNILNSTTMSTGVNVIAAQDNRVPEPASPDFITMTMIRRERIETNVDQSADAKFTGSIAGNVLTITEVFAGSLGIGSNIFGNGVATNTVVTALGTGTGGDGTYSVIPAQTVGSRTLSAGTTSITQNTKLTMQLDVHGPNSTDNAQIISTVFRDAYGVQLFANQPYGVVPLYADDPAQIPFLDAEQQFETRWMVQALLQCNIVVSVPQLYADSVALDLVSVDEAYPP